jgi:3-carboxy-cis,cis-muconate cycloisomerase
VRLDRDRLAPSNAALVRRVVELCERHERPVATWAQARDMLGLPGRLMPAAVLRHRRGAGDAAGRRRAGRGAGRARADPRDGGAEAIHRATMELQVDPSALAAETGRNAVPVPALVAAFRAEMKAPEHAQFVHWGATSQDIMDTGLVLRLRKVLEIAEARIGRGAERTGRARRGACGHADGRAHLRAGGDAHELRRGGGGLGRAAPPAQGGACALRPRLLVVSLGGAAGTLSAMGSAGA